MNDRPRKPAAFSLPADATVPPARSEPRRPAAFDDAVTLTPDAEDPFIATTIDLLPAIPEGRLVVTESGILAAADVGLMRAHGVNAFLVGEAFMRAASPGQALAALFGRPLQGAADAAGPVAITQQRPAADA